MKKIRRLIWQIRYFFIAWDTFRHWRWDGLWLLATCVEDETMESKSPKEAFRDDHPYLH